MTDLVSVVNRLRSHGFSYERIKEKLVEMGNTAAASDAAIAAYGKEMCGV